MTPVQTRFDGVAGYGLPLRPEALAELSEFERGHMLVLGLHDEQVAVAEAAVAAVREGSYGRGRPR
jgi:hypothetical protein